MIGKTGDIDVIAPSLIVPLRLFCISEIVSRIDAQLARIMRDQSATRLPSSVTPYKRWPRPRLNSVTPSSNSSCLIPFERLGCFTLQREAALPKWSSSMTAIKYSSCFKNIPSNLWATDRRFLVHKLFAHFVTFAHSYVTEVLSYHTAKKIPNTVCLLFRWCFSTSAAYLVWWLAS